MRGDGHQGGMCPTRYICTPASHTGSDPSCLIGRFAAPPLINIKAKRGDAIGCGGGWSPRERREVEVGCGPGGWMEVVGWEEGGRRVGVLREKATSVLHAYFIKEKWRDGSERRKGRDGQA